MWTVPIFSWTHPSIHPSMLLLISFIIFHPFASHIAVSNSLIGLPRTTSAGRVFFTFITHVKTTLKTTCDSRCLPCGGDGTVGLPLFNPSSVESTGNWRQGTGTGNWRQGTGGSKPQPGARSRGSYGSPDGSWPEKGVVNGHPNHGCLGL